MIYIIVNSFCFVHELQNILSAAVTVKTVFPFVFRVIGGVVTS